MEERRVKLGKGPAKIDGRTIKFKSIIKPELLPPLPEEWEFSKKYPQFDLSPKDWGNTQLGNCVYVASMAQQRDFEVIEQGLVIPIDEEFAKKDYLEEAGGDNGLIMLDHLKRWRNNGLPIGKRKFLCFSIRRNYKIHAFASIDDGDAKSMMYATYLLGCNVGALMPDSFYSQWMSKHPWDDTSLSPSWANGHCMKVRGWTKDGLLLWTWGTLQLATWDWVRKYCDECYAIVDDVDEFLPDSPIDVEGLEALLRSLAG